MLSTRTVKAEVPAGAAWMRFLAKHDKPELYDKDQSHPTLAGSYLAACVFLATLLNINPTGNAFAPPGILSDDKKNAANHRLERMQQEVGIWSGRPKGEIP